MITVIFHIEVMQGQLDTFLRATQANIPDRLAAEGCLRYEVYQQEDAPHHFTMIEVFESQETIDVYYATPQHHRWHAMIKPIIVSIRGNDYQRVE